MARKNLLESVLKPETSNQEASGTRTNYALKGASGKMKASLDTLAENSKKLLEGETIIEINPELIDTSFVHDRLALDDDDFTELLKTIERDGQDTPVLLRPHPTVDGRYMTVFGHRRVKAARELKRQVRAIVKDMDDIAHILAQGQENSARADLSFIEKALFAKRLLDMNHSKDVIQAALTIDATLLSRMLSVSQKISEDVIAAIGPAKDVGRDRWEAFKKLVILPANTKKVRGLILQDTFDSLDSNKRFELLLNALQSSGKKTKKSKPVQSSSIQLSDIGDLKVGKTDIRITVVKEHRDKFSEFLEKEMENIIKKYKSTLD